MRTVARFSAVRAGAAFALVVFAGTACIQSRETSSESAPAAALAAPQQQADGPSGWRQHELSRPYPPVVTPAPGHVNVPPPSDAIVLFDGTDLSAFVTGPANEPREPGWKVENGYMEVVPGTGSLRTRESFGDVQLHVEFMTPDPPANTGQNRGNSGIILMGRYEIQVLDSYQHEDTYPDGIAGAIYGQYPPLVNAARAPGQWQSYDIFFRRPRFNPDGSLAEPARVTLLHNGVLVQNNEMIWGPTAPPPPYQYVAHEDELPFTIQDHGQPVRFRNIWVRKLQPLPEPPPDYYPTPVALTQAQLQGMTGSYYRAGPDGQPSQNPAYVITVQGGEVMVQSGNSAPVRAIPIAVDRLWLTGRAGELVLTWNEE